jgi:hypothetical protein
MRVMEIPSFPRTIDIPDLENLLRARLSQTVVMWPSQAIPLLGYMCCPNDPQAREKFVLTVQSWPEESTAIRPDMPARAWQSGECADQGGAAVSSPRCRSWRGPPGVDAAHPIVLAPSEFFGRAQNPPAPAALIHQDHEPAAP